MNRSDVTKEQAAQTCAALYKPTNYLIRLRRRMERLGFPHDDPLFLLACAAHDAVNRLRLDLHYLSCGVGEPGRGGHAPPPTV